MLKLADNYLALLVIIQRKQAIIAAVPTARVQGRVGRSTSFEVVLNGKCIWSKLGNGSLPDFQSVIDSVQQCVSTGEITIVTKAEEMCTIL